MRIGKRFSDPWLAQQAVRDFKKSFFDATGVAIAVQNQPLPKLEHAVSWLVLPFNFIYRNLIGRAIASVKPPLSCFDKVRVSWSLGYKHIQHLIKTPTQRRV